MVSEQERIRGYERDKKMLSEQHLTPAEYEEKLREIIKKWRI